MNGIIPHYNRWTLLTILHLKLPLSEINIFVQYLMRHLLRVHLTPLISHPAIDLRRYLNLHCLHLRNNLPNFSVTRLRPQSLRRLRPFLDRPILYLLLYLRVILLTRPRSYRHIIVVTIVAQQSSISQHIRLACLMVNSLRGNCPVL